MSGETLVSLLRLPAARRAYGYLGWKQRISSRSDDPTRSDVIPGEPAGGDAPGVPVTGHEYALFELSRRVTRFTCPRCGRHPAVDAGICFSCSATSSAAAVARLHATISRLSLGGMSSSLRSTLLVAAP